MSRPAPESSRLRCLNFSFFTPQERLAAPGALAPSLQLWIHRWVPQQPLRARGVGPQLSLRLPQRFVRGPASRDLLDELARRVALAAQLSGEAGLSGLFGPSGVPLAPGTPLHDGQHLLYTLAGKPLDFLCLWFYGGNPPQLCITKMLAREAYSRPRRPTCR